ncbi:MAG: hypothetical protein QXD23_03600 [Candidatus Micrarchaeaceae archaeon]
MKIDKSLLEVWEWKEKVFKENENLSLRAAVEKMSREEKLLMEKYGLHLKKIQINKVKN